jgi:hypothetical protein
VRWKQVKGVVKGGKLRDDSRRMWNWWGEETNAERLAGRFMRMWYNAKYVGDVSFAWKRRLVARRKPASLRDGQVVRRIWTRVWYTIAAHLIMNRGGVAIRGLGYFCNATLEEVKRYAKSERREIIKQYLPKRGLHQVMFTPDSTNDYYFFLDTAEAGITNRILDAYARGVKYECRWEEAKEYLEGGGLPEHLKMVDRTAVGATKVMGMPYLSPKNEICGGYVARSSRREDLRVGRASKSETLRAIWHKETLDDDVRERARLRLEKKLSERRRWRAALSALAARRRTMERSGLWRIGVGDEQSTKIDLNY